MGGALTVEDLKAGAAFQLMQNEWLSCLTIHQSLSRTSTIFDALFTAVHISSWPGRPALFRTIRGKFNFVMAPIGLAQAVSVTCVPIAPSHVDG